MEDVPVKYMDYLDYKKTLIDDATMTPCFVWLLMCVLALIHTKKGGDTMICVPYRCYYCLEDTAIN